MAVPIDIDTLRDKLGIGDDKVYGAMGEFAEPEDLVKAGRKIREMGYTRIDAMSPFPVHGIDDAIGVPASKLGWIVIFFSLTGTAAALLLQWYAGAGPLNTFLLKFGLSGYPLTIGGKPFFDLSYSIPVDFELTILFTAFATFIGMFAINGLPRLYHPSMNYRNAHRATDDRFLLVIEADDPNFSPAKAADDLRSVGARDVEVVEG
ncbi:MAG: DUF3341 domain-containing protein [Bryobacterales bacterium]|nr:DUF3341 domain-containing protein [Bryobacterales bacterium]MBV9400196.1 DUF3341 domain-containing protein [Bryobacterales bacterium]